MGTDAGIAELLDELLDPAVYPGAVDEVELRETHISWVFLAGGFAYKFKKPLELDFLDYSTLARRRLMCVEELRLNRRLAPDYYLEVVALSRREGGLALVAADEPEPIDYAVRMRRIPADRVLERLIRERRLERADLGAVAARLAAFHTAAEAVADPGTSVANLTAALRENAAALSGAGPGRLEPATVAAAGAYTDAFLRRWQGELRDRAERGLARDCHGDLRAEHVIVDAGVQVYDCVEFNAELREIDVAADLAFLVMDLERLGAGDEIEWFVERYREAGGDPGDRRMLAGLAAYRAWVRTKVALIRAAGLDPATPQQRHAVAEARELLTLGRRLAWRSRLPLVLCVCGTAATGKSTVARAAATASGLPHLAADVVRKRLAGLEPTQRGPEAIYSPAFSLRTYRELGRLAAVELEAGGGAIVDATFRRRADRDAFRAGLGAAGPRPVFTRCSAPEEVLRQRARDRATHPDRISDAGPEAVERQIGAFEPFDADEGAVGTIDTTVGEQAALAAVERLLDGA
jgi:uncharacterized protein